MSGRVGFTGTRKALTQAQTAELNGVLMSPGPDELHHGDCIGADATAHAFAQAYRRRVVLHPPDDPSHRAWCPADEARRPLPYLQRNKALVAETDWLLAMPDGPERLRSGTWSTVRYAVSLNRYVMVVMPDGSIVEPGPIKHLTGVDA